MELPGFVHDMDCLRIIVDQLETLLRAYLDYLMTIMTWVTLDYLPLKIRERKTKYTEIECALIWIDLPTKSTTLEMG